MKTRIWRILVLLAAVLLVPSAVRAAERWTVGLTANGVPMETLAVAGAAANSPTVLLVGGLQGRDQTSDVVAREVTVFEARSPKQRPFRLLAIPIANPDAQPLQFPPTGAAYREHIESHVLWRWIGTHAPDLVLIVGPVGAGRRALPEHRHGYRTNSGSTRRSRREDSRHAHSAHPAIGSASRTGPKDGAVAT